jgi:WD40 repeat protein
MAARKIGRKRGTVLTATGDRKLQAARKTAELVNNFGERYTNEELSALTGLSVKTIAKIFSFASVAVGEQIPVDKQTLDICFAAFKIALAPEDYFYPDVVVAQTGSANEPAATDRRDCRLAERQASVPVKIESVPIEDRSGLTIDPAFIDCGEAPDIEIFYGRERELAQLREWAIGERCRTICLLGMGGIGKTALVTKLTHQLQPHFSAIVWRSLRNAPPLASLLAKLIEICSRRAKIVPANMEISDRISCLLEYFRQERCLVVLDNVETILQADRDPAESAGYAELFRRIGESQHQSCLLLTSREKPQALVPLEGAQLPVRTLGLQGLSPRESESLFDAKGLSSSLLGRSRLVENYSGNPLALNIVATSISDLFGGDIMEFLAAEISIFSDIRQLLDRQMAHLTPIELSIMYWLAIDREWTSLTDLHAEILPSIPKLSVLEALESLSRKSLIERSSGKFTQQAVVMEYMTARLIDRVVRELIDWDLSGAQPQQSLLWLSYAIPRASSPEYIRAAQKRLILEPIASQLRAHFGRQAAIARHIKAIVASLQTHYQGILHYGGGNAIDLLRYLQVDLTGSDFSNLPIWQADLQGATLHDVNFSRSDLNTTIVTKNFGWISTLTFSPDSQILATGEYSGNICLWRVGDRYRQHKLRGHTNWIWSLAFSPDGRLLASASQDRMVRIWDVVTGSCVRVFTADSYQVLTLAFHPDGRTIASGHGNGMMRLWDVATGELTHTISAHPRHIGSMRFSHDGRSLVTGSDDTTVKIWRIDGDKIPTLQHTLTAHTKRVWSVRFSPNDRFLATGSSDGTIRLWEMATLTVVDIFPVYPNWMFSMDFSPDGRLLAAGNSHKEVKIWDVSPDRVASSTAILEPPADLAAKVAIATLHGHEALASTCKFSPDGKLLATGSSERTVRLWDTHSWHELSLWQGFTNTIASVRFAPDGNRLAAANQDCTISIWDRHTGNCVSTLTGHRQSLLAVDYSPNGRFIGSASADGTVKIWAAESGELVRTISAHPGGVWRIVFSPDSRLVASSGMDNQPRIWVVETGESVATFLGHTHMIRSLAFSPDCQRLITGSFDACWRSWDIASGELLGRYSGHTNWLWDLALSPDGRLLVTGSSDRTAKLWDANTGELLQTFAEHTDEVLAIAFSPQGRQFATGSEDRSIKIWDIETGRVLQTLTGHLDRLLSLSYSPDGSVLASSSADETIKFWDLTTGTHALTCKVPAPYTGMDITGITGLNKSTIESLKTLGAISRD